MCDAKTCCNSEGRICTEDEMIEASSDCQAGSGGFTLPGVYVDTGDVEVNDFLRDVFSTMQSKGHDYRQGNDADLLHNFRTVANTVGIDMEKVWFTYFYKHYSAMCTFIKEGGQSESEPIEGRIKDQIVYLLLFYKMVQERRRLAQAFERQNSPILDKVIAKAAKDIAEEEDRRILKELSDLIPGRPARPLRLRSSTVVDVPAEDGVIEVDRDRVRKNAGILGAYVPEETIQNSKRILNKIEEKYK